MSSTQNGTLLLRKKFWQRENYIQEFSFPMKIKRGQIDIMISLDIMITLPNSHIKIYLEYI